MPSKRLFLIDSFGFIFRAYHARARSGAPPMRTSTGLSTEAVYIFSSMLRKLTRQHEPPYMAAVFESSEPTHRLQEFPEYKANRAEAPPDLAEQIPYVRRVLEAMRIPVLEYPGFEADDVIGAIARRAESAGFEVVVVSSDKDLLQLVTDRVSMLNPAKDDEWYDPEKVKTFMGVTPAQVADLLALKGDAIDNIPGAPGIGDKGARDLIERFGSVEAAIEHAAEVERKTYRESLQNNAEQIRMSKRLATLTTDIPIEFAVESVKAQPADVPSLKALYKELEFHSLVKELGPGEDARTRDYRPLSGAAEIAAFLGAAAGKPVAVAILRSGTAESDPVDPIAQEFAATRGRIRQIEEKALRQLNQGRAGQSRIVTRPSETAGELFSDEEVEQATANATGTFLSPRPGGGTPPLQAGGLLHGCSLGLAWKPGEARSVSGADIAHLKPWLEDASAVKISCDVKSVLLAFAELEIEARGFEHDVMLYAFLLDADPSGCALEEQAARRLDLKVGPTPEQQADITLEIYPDLSEAVDARGLRKLYAEIELPLAGVLARMERTGIRIDPAELKRLSDIMQRDIARLTSEIHTLAGKVFNIASPQQLGRVLFEDLGLPAPARSGKAKSISTAADVLEDLAADHDIVRKVLEYRQLTKLKGTYVDALPALLDSRTGRLHTSFNQTGAATGRLSSSNPNLQNIPIRTELGREIRAAFVPRQGWKLMAADYSQIELRLLAHMSGDPLLVEAFRNGEDIHTLTAAEVLGVPPLMVTPEARRSAKAVNFGIVYGISPFGLAAQLGISRAEADQYIRRYFERYAGVRRFIDETIERVRQTGVTRTLFGRERPIPDMNSRNPNLRGFAERTAVNTPLQGTAADLIKLAMVRIDAALASGGFRSAMLLQVHDELIFECPPEELEPVTALVKREMEAACPLDVPLLVDIGIGDNWRDAK